MKNNLNPLYAARCSCCADGICVASCSSYSYSRLQMFYTTLPDCITYYIYVVAAVRVRLILQRCDQANTLHMHVLLQGTHLLRHNATTDDERHCDSQAAHDVLVGRNRPTGGARRRCVGSYLTTHSANIKRTDCLQHAFPTKCAGLPIYVSLIRL